MLMTKRLALRVSYLLSVLAIATLVTSPNHALADSTSGWVYQGWESVKAGTSVDGAGNWYAWGSLYFGGQIVEADDPNLLWLKGQLFRWDGSKAVICTETGWLHPKVTPTQRGMYAYTSGVAAGGSPFQFPCGSGWYIARSVVYSQVSDANGNPVFHGGHLDTPWVWVNR